MILTVNKLLKLNVDEFEISWFLEIGESSSVSGGIKLK